MKILKHRITRCSAKWFSLLVLSLILLPGTSAAQSEKEKKVLNLFFHEKDLFSSVTRHPKPVSQIAENVSIVTAKQIEAMNAHSVAEVLNRVTGLFVNFSQGAGSFGSTSLLHMQGSEDRHVLVLVDGIPWNSLSGGTAETHTIPVGIIDRIEIIKGPASSSWGSSLGGVIQVFTKSPGYTSGPTGSVRGAYGERRTQDYRAEASGRAGRLGYFLFGGRQESDGFDARRFASNQYFSKFSYVLSNKVEAGLSLGYSEPENGLGAYETADIRSNGANRNFWGTLFLDAAFTRELTFNLRLFRFDQKSGITNTALGLGLRGPEGSLFQKSVYDEQTTGGSASLILEKGIHTAVFGVDINRGELDQTIESGLMLQAMGFPEQLHTQPGVDRTGVYLNDTLSFARLSVTPGIRYDHNSRTGSFLSPSLGMTYRMGAETLLRGSVARGFMAPLLSWTSGGALFLEPNPSLGEERVWSYQAGIESAVLRFAWLKGTFFRHEIDAVHNQQLSRQAPYRVFVNDGESRRQGIEIEAETLPFYHVALRASGAYVNLSPENANGADDMVVCNVGLTYDNPEILRAELFGHYIWWDARAIAEAEYDAVIWDVNVSKRVFAGENLELDLFLTGHNIFNGAQYLIADNKNPGRWFETGLKVFF